jgi:NTE family protein
LNSDSSFSASEDKILFLDDCPEEKILKFIVNDMVDCLSLRLDKKENFFSLLNFLSERYHFIIYEIPKEFLKKDIDDFSQPAHKLHFLVFPKTEVLRKTGAVIKELKNKNPLNEDKIEVILMKFKSRDSLPFRIKKAILKHRIYATLPSCEDQDYPKALRRIARQIGEVTLGLVLGSGAAYGFSHIGVLKVFEKNNIDIDIICGASTGALVAALWATGFTPLEIEEFADEFARKITSFSIAGFSFPFRGIMRAKRLENIFRSIFSDLTFYDLKHSLKIVVFDFLKRKTIVLEEGLIYKAVAASCAFPGIFEPVKLKKNILLDGGILTPLPTKVLLRYNAHKIVASNISLSPEQARRVYNKRSRFHIFDFIFGSIETMQQQFIEQAKGVADVVIHPNLEGLGWMEFNKLLEFIKRGETAAQKKIEEIKTLSFL